jgi:hypothetical protein
MCIFVNSYWRFGEITLSIFMKKTEIREGIINPTARL